MVRQTSLAGQPIRKREELLKGLVSRLYAICTAAARSAAQSYLATSPPILLSYLNILADQSDSCS